MSRRAIHAYEREPSGVAQVRSSPFLRFWLALLGRQVRYPYYSGLYEDKSGFAVEFYFEAEAPIHEVQVTLYGQTTGAKRLSSRVRLIGSELSLGFGEGPYLAMRLGALVKGVWGQVHENHRGWAGNLDV